MAISSLIDMGAALGTASMNLGSQVLTNQSNERNVDATNRTNLAITESTNDANLQIAKETNASNERIMQQTNEFNAAQADLAYQRSTSSAKVAELIAAGLSPQQARQVVAGAGLTGSATPAQGTAIPAQGATMQASQMQAYQKQPLDFGGFAQSFHSLGEFFDRYIESFDREDGGYYGTMLANDAFEQCIDHVSDLSPTALSSDYNFQTWLNAQGSGFWKDFREGSAYKKVKSNPLAYRSFFYRMNKSFNDAADVENKLALYEIRLRREALQEINDKLQNKFTDEQIKSLIKTQQKVSAEIALLDSQTEGNRIQNSRSQIILERDKKTADLITDAEIYRFRNAIADEKLRQQLLTNPTYMQAYFKAALNNQLWQCALNSYSARLAEQQNNFLSEHPDDELTIAIFSFLDQVGFANTQLCQDLQENYLAGSSISDFMLKNVSEEQFGIFTNAGVNGRKLYRSLTPVWSWRNSAQPLFKRGSSVPSFPSLKFGE